MRSYEMPRRWAEQQHHSNTNLYKSGLDNKENSCTFCPPRQHHEPKTHLHKQQDILMSVHPQRHHWTSATFQLQWYICHPNQEHYGQKINKEWNSKWDDKVSIQGICLFSFSGLQFMEWRVAFRSKLHKHFLAL